MSTRTIRFKEEEEKAIEDYSAFMGQSFSEVVRNAILEKLEDEYDIRVGEEAYEEYLKDPVTYTPEEVRNELGL